MTKLIWEGEPSSIHVNSGGYEYGSVRRRVGQETIDNDDGAFTRNEVFDTLLPKFQNDIILFSKDEFYIGEVESTCEYYDYDAHFHGVIKVEQRECGDLEVTINYHSSGGKANADD